MNIDKNELAGFVLNPQVLVEITSRCNFSCDYCISSFKERPKIDMKFDLFANIVDQVSKLTDKSLRMHVDGEPTLHPEFHEMAKYANKSGLRINLATNGSRLQRKFLDLDMDLVITVSGNAEEFSQRHKTMNFDKYINRVIDYVNKWVTSKTNQNLVVQVNYAHLMHRDEGYCQDKDKFIVNFIKKCGLNPFSHKDDQGQMIFKRPDNRWLRIVRHHVVSGGLFPENGKRVENKYTKCGFCDSPWKRLAILADGCLGFCCLDLSGKTSFANFETEGFDINNLWLHNNKLVKVRNEFLKKNVVNPVCQRCLAVAPGNVRIVGFN